MWTEWGIAWQVLEMGGWENGELLEMSEKGENCLSLTRFDSSVVDNYHCFLFFCCLSLHLGGGGVQMKMCLARKLAHSQNLLCLWDLHSNCKLQYTVNMSFWENKTCFRSSSELKGNSLEKTWLNWHHLLLYYYLGDIAYWTGQFLFKILY